MQINNKHEILDKNIYLLHMNHGMLINKDSFR